MAFVRLTHGLSMCLVGLSSRLGPWDTTARLYSSLVVRCAVDRLAVQSHQTDVVCVYIDMSLRCSVAVVPKLPFLLRRTVRLEGRKHACQCTCGAGRVCTCHADVPKPYLVVVAMEGILVDAFQPATAVGAVGAGCFISGSPERQLLAAVGDAVQLWQAAPGFSTLQITQTFHLFEAIEQLVLVPADLHLWGSSSPDAVLVFTADQRCSLFRLQEGRQLGLYTLTEECSLGLFVPTARGESCQPKRVSGICTSNVNVNVNVTAVGSTSTAQQPSSGVLVVSVFMGVLHVLTLTAGPAKPSIHAVTVEVADTPLSSLLPGGCPPAHIG